MGKELLHEDQFLTIEYSDRGNYLLFTWRSFAPYDTFCALIDKGTELLKLKKATGFILDTREHKGAGESLQEYAAMKTEQFIKENYPLKQAIIVPEDIFSRLSVENYSKRVKKKVINPQMAYFDKVEEAKKWFLE